ncbi:patatin-like phospholipase family protein [Sediminitomix flava]|uniref:Putative acylesterase/phospholipase RssA n=1 Tax=Sediminitomix flava TaxID=379075 RepID=A0A315ZLF4_SEDFL|nr:patatin-like phospholipase family protein [Sediminitomix flava]PWJ35004.1 putative acylesterase/phospholipase RssA [Sediminitomix flava]
MGKKALVLSAGSITGAFQAGAIQQVLDSGFEPDIIHGTSVGSINGGVMVSEIGRLNNEFDWKEIGEYVAQTWMKQFIDPSSVMVKKNRRQIIYEIMTNRFNGLVSAHPIQNFIRENVSLENVRKSIIDFSAAAVDLVSGKVDYFDALSNNLVEGIVASATIPIVMPTTYVGGTPYYDGALRDVAPIKYVIDKGADEIIIIVCQSQDISNKNLHTGNLMHLITRIMDITVNETVNNDIEELRSLHSLVPVQHANFTSNDDKRIIKYKVIRPNYELGYAIDNFERKDIYDMISLGRITAQNTNNWSCFYMNNESSVSIPASV